MLVQLEKDVIVNEILQGILDNVPLSRLADPEEIGRCVRFLASDEAEYILAQCYNVDGGQWMS